MTPYKKARAIFYLALMGEEFEVDEKTRTALYRVRKRSKVKKMFKSRTVNEKIIVWQVPMT